MSESASSLMSSYLIPPLPSDITSAAESAFAREHPYLRLGRSIQNVWHEFDLAALVKEDRALADCFYPHSLATILQYWECLSDNQMSQASRTRVEMKYAMHLSLNYPGVEPLALCAFRRHILMAGAGKDAFKKMIDYAGRLVGREERVEVDQLVSTVCSLVRAETILEYVNVAIEAIATNCPKWLLANALPHWFERYRRSGYRQLLQDCQDTREMLVSVGKDGQYLLNVIESTDASCCRDLWEVQRLKHEWEQQFENENSDLKLCELDCPSCMKDLMLL